MSQPRGWMRTGKILDCISYFFDKICHRDCNFPRIYKYSSEPIYTVESNLPKSGGKQRENKEEMKSSLVSELFTHLCEKSSKTPTVLINHHSHLLAGCLNPHFTTQSSGKGEQNLLTLGFHHIQIIPAISVSGSCFQVIYLLDKQQSHHAKSLLFRNFKPSRRAPAGGFERDQG